MTALLLFTIWLLPAVYVHALHSISLTSAQRLAVLNAISEKSPLDTLAKLDSFKQTSFDHHLWRVLTLRKPWSIYPESLSNEVWRAGA